MHVQAPRGAKDLCGLSYEGLFNSPITSGENTRGMYAVSEFIRGALTDRLFLRLTPKTKQQPDANPADAAINAAGRILILPLLCLLISVFWFPASAHAACASPAGPEGDIAYNSTFHVMQYCDNLNVWRAMGSAGAGGAGCSGPAGIEGALMYNGTYHMLQWCDGTSWQAVTAASSSSFGPTTGLVGWWKFDETSGTSAADSSSTGNTGTLTAAGTSWVAGKINNAVNTDGNAGHYVDIPSNAAYDSTTGTWAGWFKTSAACSGNGCVIMTRADTSSSGSGIVIYLWNDHKLYAAVYCVGGGGSCNPLTVGGGSNLNDGNWHHFALTFNGTSTANFYIDGVLVQSGTPSQAWSFNANPVRFGQALDTWWQKLAGSIDDARIYNRVLSATEVTALARNGCTGVGLAGWWKMDEGAGGTTADSSGNGNTGTLTNSPTWTTSGKYNDALVFANASNNYVDVANPANFAFERTNPFSLSAWVYRTSAATEGVIIAKETGPTAWTGYSLWMPPDGTPNWCNGVACTTNCLIAELNNDAAADANDMCIQVNGSAVTTNAWHHVVATYDGSVTVAGIRLYVDGVLQTPSTSLNTLTASILNATDLKIGTDAPVQNDSFTGTIDDARVYNRVLSSGEIKNLYTTGTDAVEGQLMYNATSHIPQFCDGTNWRATK